MKILRLAKYPIDGLLLPGDWPKILRDPAVEKMAASIKVIGNVHPPIVRFSDKRLIAGRRRTAAMLGLGEEEPIFQFVECSDEECELIALAENAVREHDLLRQAKDISSLVDRLAKLHKEASPKESRGQVAKAVKQVALAKGVSEHAVRKQRYREKKKKANPAATPKTDVEKAVEREPIESPWFNLAPDFIAAVVKIQTCIDGIDQALKNAQGALTKITSLPHSEFPYMQEGNAQRLLEDLGAVANRVRGLRPVHLCPWCKGQTETQRECAPCEQTGWLGRHQMTGVPPEYLRLEEPVVLYRKVAVPLADLGAELPEPITNVLEGTAEEAVMRELDAKFGELNPFGDFDE